jgi:hypothetical protein
VIKPIGQYVHIAQLKIIPEHIAYRGFFQGIIYRVCIGAACKKHKANTQYNFKIKSVTLFHNNNFLNDELFLFSCERIIRFFNLSSISFDLMTDLITLLQFLFIINNKV